MRLFAGFERALGAAGHLALGGQIVEASVVEARRPRLNEDAKATVRGWRPEAWSPAKRAQMDTDGRGTSKRGRQGSPGRVRESRGAGLSPSAPGAARHS